MQGEFDSVNFAVSNEDEINLEDFALIKSYQKLKVFEKKDE